MAVFAIALLWVAFAATHMGMSSQGLRPRLVEKLGERGFQGVYSLVALATFVPLVSIYFDHQHQGPHLWYLGYLPAVRWAAYVAMAVALVLVVGSFVQPSPASLTGKSTEVRGVLRITRHPLLMGIGVFGLAHLLTANVNAAELAFFAGFPVFVVLGCAHQDRRKLAGGGEAYAGFVAATAFLPFTRPGALRGLGESAVPLVVGILLAVGLRYVHAGWFGGAAW